MRKLFPFVVLVVCLLTMITPGYGNCCEWGATCEWYGESFAYYNAQYQYCNAWVCPSFCDYYCDPGACPPEECCVYESYLDCIDECNQEYCAPLLHEAIYWGDLLASECSGSCYDNYCWCDSWGTCEPQ